MSCFSGPDVAPGPQFAHPDVSRGRGLDATLRPEAARRRRLAVHLTYPNVISKPGEILLRAVVVSNLLVAAS